MAFVLAGAPYHYGDLTIGLFGLVGAAGALCANVAGRWADRGWSTTTTLAFALCVGVSFLPLWLGGHDLLWLIAGILVLDVGVQGLQVTNQSLIYRLAPDSRSRVNSAYMVCYFAGGAIGSAARRGPLQQSPVGGGLHLRCGHRRGGSGGGAGRRLPRRFEGAPPGLQVECWIAERHPPQQGVVPDRVARRRESEELELAWGRLLSEPRPLRAGRVRLGLVVPDPVLPCPLERDPRRKRAARSELNGAARWNTSDRYARRDPRRPLAFRSAA